MTHCWGWKTKSRPNPSRAKVALWLRIIIVWHNRCWHKWIADVGGCCLSLISIILLEEATNKQLHCFVSGLFFVVPAHGKRRRRRCSVVPLPAWWAAKQSPAAVWGWGARRPAGWPGSSGSGTDPCETAPSSAPTGRSERKEKRFQAGEKDGSVITQREKCVKRYEVSWLSGRRSGSVEAVCGEVLLSNNPLPGGEGMGGRVGGRTHTHSHTDDWNQVVICSWISFFALGFKASIWKQTLRLQSLRTDIKLRPLNFQTSACFVHRRLDTDLIKPKSFDPPERGNLPSWRAMSVFSEDGKHFAWLSTSTYSFVF